MFLVMRIGQPSPPRLFKKVGWRDTRGLDAYHSRAGRILQFSLGWHISGRGESVFPLLDSIFRAVLFQLPQLVCGLGFGFGRNLVWELDGRELRSTIAVALNETGH